MAAEPVLPWDTRVLVGAESAFGTVPDPTAAQALEFISIDTGPVELGEVRPKKDRNAGRGMTNGYVIGRVKPLPWSLDVSVKTRTAVATVPNESALYKACGLTQTVNGGTNVTYSLSGAPVQDASFASISLYRALGLGTGSTSSRYFAEQLRGGIVKQLTITGGDRELMYKFSGEAIGKYHLGYSSSLTTADGVSTTLTFGSAEEAYRFDQGWYQWESEIIKITSDMAAGATTATMARAQLSSSGAAHSAKPLVPYLPAIAYTGSPIPETTCSVVCDSQTIRFTGFEISFTTGMEMGPGETGSAFVQTPIVKRNNVSVTLKGMMRREDVALLGKAKRKLTPVAVVIACGTGVGGIVTFNLPFCEVNAMSVPDNANDVAMWSVTLRARDNAAAGNDMMTIVCT